MRPRPPENSARVCARSLSHPLCVGLPQLRGGLPEPSLSGGAAIHQRPSKYASRIPQCVRRMYPYLRPTRMPATQGSRFAPGKQSLPWASGRASASRRESEPDATAAETVASTTAQVAVAAATRRMLQPDVMEVMVVEPSRPHGQPPSRGLTLWPPGCLSLASLLSDREPDSSASVPGIDFIHSRVVTRHYRRDLRDQVTGAARLPELACETCAWF